MAEWKKKHFTEFKKKLRRNKKKGKKGIKKNK